MPLLLLFFIIFIAIIYAAQGGRSEFTGLPAPEKGPGIAAVAFLSRLFFVCLFVLIWLFVLPPVISPFPLSGGSNMAGDGLFGGRWRREELSAAPARPARC